MANTIVEELPLLKSPSTSSKSLKKGHRLPPPPITSTLLRVVQSRPSFHPKTYLSNVHSSLIIGSSNQVNLKTLAGALQISYPYLLFPDSCLFVYIYCYKMLLPKGYKNFFIVADV